MQTTLSIPIESGLLIRNRAATVQYMQGYRRNYRTASDSGDVNELS